MGQKPEFSNFSWFSMMFGAGLGVDLMTFATAEPLGLRGSNPAVLAGEVQDNTAEVLQATYPYTFAHYGFHAWAIYVMVGLSLAYFAYTRDLPLTVRSALTTLLGRYANGVIGVSVVSGVGHGVKYLSNLNLLLTFIVFGSFLFATTTYAGASIRCCIAKFSRFDSFNL